MFKLQKDELVNLRFQFGTSSWGGRRYSPHAFTENGVAMLSSVLNSRRAIEVNIQIMRTFTKIRQLLSSHADLLRKLEGMEKKYDYQFKIDFPVRSRYLHGKINIECCAAGSPNRGSAGGAYNMVVIKGL